MQTIFNCQSDFELNSQSSALKYFNWKNLDTRAEKTYPFNPALIVLYSFFGSMLNGYNTTSSVTIPELSRYLVNSNLLEGRNCRKSNRVAYLPRNTSFDGIHILSE